MTVVEVCGATYHMDEKLKVKWDRLRDGRLAKYDEDRFYIVDGAEGSGKSLFTFQNAAYIDPTILDDVGEDKIPRICFSVQEFLTAIRSTKSTKGHTKVVVFDEAFRGMSSKSSLSKNNKLLVECLMEARQNNLVVFIVSPSFYLLEFYGAVLRSQALFHVIKEKKTRRRYVRVFSKKQKAILYQIGVRKGWGYPLKTRFRIRFFNIYPGGPEFEKRYRKKKSDNFGVDSNKSKAEIAYYDKAEEYKRQRDLLFYYIKKYLEFSPHVKRKTRFTNPKICAALKNLGIKITPQSFGAVCSDVAFKFNKARDLTPSEDLAEEDEEDKDAPGNKDENLPDFGD